jgi:protein ImuB
MSLEGMLVYERVICPATPSNDRQFLLKLLQLEIAAHPPHAAIITLTLTADTDRQGKMQLGLFTPQTPEASRLDITLARLKALVGADRVGSPALNDTHRSGSFKMENFLVRNDSKTLANTSVRISLRRMRPPRSLCVQLHFAKPASFSDGEDRYEVRSAYGPWHSSGCWWSIHQWDTEEWDVMATNNMGDTIGCLIVHDNLKSKWLLDAFYD